MSQPDLVSSAQRDTAHHLHPLSNPLELRDRGPQMISRAEGVHLFDPDGRRWLDFGSGMSNVNIGYGNARVCAAADAAMRQLSFGHTAYRRTNPWVADLSEKLSELTPPQFQRFLFGSTGSEAIETAVKVALRYWRLRGRPTKRAVISRELSYHGNTLFAASLTGISAFHDQFGLPITDLIHRVDSPHWQRDGNGRSIEDFTHDILASFEGKIREIGPDNIAAFVGDPIQTGGGSIIPPPQYWPGVRRLCDRYDILLIADEIISGFGKTGTMFGFEQFGFEPDLIVMSKGITSGYFPLSVVGVGAKIDEVFSGTDETFSHVFTNCGHPVGAAIALENIAVIEEDGLVERVATGLGPALAAELQRLADELPFVRNVRSMGVIGAFDVQPPDADEAVDAFLSRAIEISWSKGLVVRAPVLALPMITSDAQLEEGMAILRESLAEAASSR